MIYFYLPASGQTIAYDSLQRETGFPPTTSLEVLAANGIYQVVPSEDPYDPNLYSSFPTYTISGYYADQGWGATPRPLSNAKASSSNEIRQRAGQDVETVQFQSGFPSDVFTAVSSQAILSRPARYQDYLDEMVVVTDKLDSDLTAISSATTVDEINNIVNPPTGTLFTGRGAGLGPEDLNESYYTSFNSVSMTEADTELYVPGTATVIPYGIPNPGEFDSLGNCFNVGDYLIQIRETATSMVIAEFEVPLNLVGEDVSF